MTQVDLLVDDVALATELRKSLDMTGVEVHQASGKTAALTGAEFHHVIQILIDSAEKVAIGVAVARMQSLLTAYLSKPKPKELEIVVDGIGYTVRNDQDLNDVLDAIASSYEQVRPKKP